MGHTSGTAGGTSADVNDPVELVQKGVRLTLEGENDWRFLGRMDPS